MVLQRLLNDTAQSDQDWLISACNASPQPGEIGLVGPPCILTHDPGDETADADPASTRRRADPIRKRVANTGDGRLCDPFVRT